MSGKFQNEKAFYPGVFYTIGEVAIKLEVQTSWVKKNLIFNRACRHKRQGEVYLFLGDWLITWAREDSEDPRYDDQDQGSTD